MRATRNTKLEWSPVMSDLGQHVTDAIDVMVSGQDRASFRPLWVQDGKFRLFLSQSKHNAPISRIDLQGASAAVLQAPDWRSAYLFAFRAFTWNAAS